jgi:hypothetical protein
MSAPPMQPQVQPLPQSQVQPQVLPQVQPQPAAFVQDTSNQNEQEDEYADEQSDDEGLNTHVSRARMFSMGTGAVGGLLSLVVLIGAIWAFQYKSRTSANPSNGSLDITQSTTSMNGSTNQNTTVTIGGTGTNNNSTNTVTYNVPVRTDRTSLFFWGLAAVLSLAFLGLLVAQSYYRPHARIRATLV